MPVFTTSAGELHYEHISRANRGLDSDYFTFTDSTGALRSARVSNLSNRTELLVTPNTAGHFETRFWSQNGSVFSRNVLTWGRLAWFLPENATFRIQFDLALDRGYIRLYRTDSSGAAVRVRQLTESGSYEFDVEAGAHNMGDNLWFDGNNSATVVISNAWIWRIR